MYASVVMVVPPVAADAPADAAGDAAGDCARPGAAVTASSAMAPRPAMLARIRVGRPCDIDFLLPVRPPAARAPARAHECCVPLPLPCPRSGDRVRRLRAEEQTAAVLAEDTVCQMLRQSKHAQLRELRRRMMERSTRAVQDPVRPDA